MEEPCGQSGKATRLRVGVVAPLQLGSRGCGETGRLLSHQVPLRATRGIRKRAKMEGGGGGGGAGTSGDGGDGGEQLLTVKHELRTGERPRPLPAGPAAGARLNVCMGAHRLRGARVGGWCPRERLCGQG